MKILIGADIVPTKSNIAAFSQAKTEDLVDDKLYSLLMSADYRIFNLEVPLTDKACPIEKCGPCLMAPADTVNGIKALGADFVTLANNHILDEGGEGLTSTMERLSACGIAYSGAGADLSAASKPFKTVIDGKTVGIYCCAEHEFTIAEENRCGANPYDPLVSFDAVSELKRECDYCIVLYHGGKEYYRYTSPQVQRVCRKFSEVGADLVVCQHTHCIGCEERYNGSVIVYGQGNFLFDDSNREEWLTSLLIEVTLSGDKAKVIYHPLEKNGAAVKLAEEPQKSNILAAFNKRSDEIKDGEFLKKKYEEFAESSYVSLMDRMHGTRTRSLLYRIAARLSGSGYPSKFIERKYGKRELLLLLNAVESESWRELVIKAVKNKLKK